MTEDKCEGCGFYGNYCDGYSNYCKDSKQKIEIKNDQRKNLLDL